MRAYLVATGTLFGLIAVAHFARTIAESQRLASDPGPIWKELARPWSPRP